MSLRNTVSYYGNGENNLELDKSMKNVRKIFGEIKMGNPTQIRIRNFGIELDRIIAMGAGEATFGSVTVIDLKRFIDKSYNNDFIKEELLKVCRSEEFNSLDYGYNKNSLREFL